MACACAEGGHECRLVVLTGGPGAGKTAVLEVVRRAFCKHVVVLPEAATVLFGGGFPRHDSEPGRRASQEAIFHVQRAMEKMIRDEGEAAVVLCDRGTLDGLAYFPGGAHVGCETLGIRLDDEIARYHAVVHMRTPPLDRGYNHANPMRTESAAEALALDARIDEAWARHPRRVIIESQVDFVGKLARAIEAIRNEVPECCRAHAIRELGETSDHAGCSSCGEVRHSR